MCGGGIIEDQGLDLSSLRSMAEMVQILTSKFYSVNKSPGYVD